MNQQCLISSKQLGSKETDKSQIDNNIGISTWMFLVIHDELQYILAVVYNIFRVRLVYCCKLNGKSMKAVAAVMDLAFGRQGARFTTDFLPAIQIRWKPHLAAIPLLAIRSRQFFAHATTAQLSCHVQNFITITVLESRWEWNEISIEFELRWKNR